MADWFGDGVLEDTPEASEVFRAVSPLVLAAPFSIGLLKLLYKMGDQNSLAEDAEDTTTCPTCSTDVPTAWEYCPECGEKVNADAEEEAVKEPADRSSEETRPCVRCGEMAPIDPGQCSECGAPVEPSPGEFLSRDYWIAFVATGVWSVFLLYAISFQSVLGGVYLLGPWVTISVIALFIYRDMSDAHEIFTPDIPRKALLFVILLVPIANVFAVYHYMYRRHSLSTPPSDKRPSNTTLLVTSAGCSAIAVAAVPGLFGLISLGSGYLIRRRRDKGTGTVLIAVAILSAIVGVGITALARAGL